MSGHGGCSHEHHDHEHEGEPGELWSLFSAVDTLRLQCLNESTPNSLQNVLRPWHQRCDRSRPKLRSNADEQLLMCIPFTSPVKIKSICVIGAGDIENPSHMSAFVDNEHMDFDSAESTKPVQSWDLVERNPDGNVEYPCNLAKFRNVSTLWLFIDRNFGAEHTEIMYLGLKGESTKYKREAVHTVYESRPMKAAEDVKSTYAGRMGM